MEERTQLETLYRGFRLYCLAEAKQPTTIRWYMGKLRIFVQYLEDRGETTDAAEITTTHLRAFLVHLRQDVRADEHNPNKPDRDENLSPRTIQGYARTLKAFFSWAYREGLIRENPGKLLRLPKAPRVLISTFSGDQVRRILAQVDRRSPIGYRNYCILLLLLDTGIRLSELVNLAVNDLDLERATFSVIGKGARERLVPFGASVQKMLWKYLNRFRPEPAHPSTPNLFLSSSGYGLSPDHVYRIVRAYGEDAGIKGVRCSPHTFRHTFAKNYLMNGGDVFSLQKILGHSSLEVVRMYVNLASGDVQAQHRLYSPVDMMNSKRK